MFSLKGPRFATNRRVLAEAGDSVKRFYDSGVLELGDRLGPVLWQFAPTKKLDERRLRQVPRTAAAQARRPPAASCGRGAAMTVSACPVSSRCCDEFETPVVFAEHGKYPAIADVVSDFVYARLQKGNDETQDLLSAKAARRLGRSAFWPGPTAKRAGGFAEGRCKAKPKKAAARRLCLRNPRGQGARTRTARWN